MADRTAALMSSTQSRRFRATMDFALMVRLSEVARMTETGPEQKPPVLVSLFTQWRKCCMLTRQRKLTLLNRQHV